MIVAKIQNSFYYFQTMLPQVQQVEGTISYKVGNNHKSEITELATFRERTKSRETGLLLSSA